MRSPALLCLPALHSQAPSPSIFSVGLTNGRPSWKLGDGREQELGSILPTPSAFCKVYLAASPWGLLLPAHSPAGVPSSAGWFPDFWALLSLGHSIPPPLHPRAAIEPKKPFIEECLLCDSTNVKFKNRQYSSVVIETRSAVAFREWRG